TGGPADHAWAARRETRLLLASDVGRTQTLAHPGAAESRYSVHVTLPTLYYRIILHQKKGHSVKQANGLPALPSAPPDTGAPRTGLPAARAPRELSRWFRFRFCLALGQPEIAFRHRVMKRSDLIANGGFGEGDALVCLLSISLCHGL